MGELLREFGKLLRVKRCDMGQEHGPIAEVFGYGGVSGYAGDGGEVENSLLLEEIEGGFELAV